MNLPQLKSKGKLIDTHTLCTHTGFCCCLIFVHLFGQKTPADRLKDKSMQSFTVLHTHCWSGHSLSSCISSRWGHNMVLHVGRLIGHWVLQSLPASNGASSDHVMRDQLLFILQHTPLPPSVHLVSVAASQNSFCCLVLVWIIGWRVYCSICPSGQGDIALHPHPRGQIQS